MSKRFITLNGFDFYHMVHAGSQRLQQNVEVINALNVFPVPDGDTGTNMNLTLSSGLEEWSQKQSAHIGAAAEIFSKGLLMGARGNSGVILSQLFRGFAESAHSHAELNAQQFAAALQEGVEMAYKAVYKPVEGTILSVSKEAAKQAVIEAGSLDDLEALMREIVFHGQKALAYTPEQLPILKQVGVVDAGGQGLMFIYEGFLSILSGAEVGVQPAHTKPKPLANVQAQVTQDTIEYGYCTEFIIKLNNGKDFMFNESGFREDLTHYGDSLLVVADEDLVKVHIHAEYPGNVMNHAMNYGQLIKIKIENMREQHSHFIHADADSDLTDKQQVVICTKPYGFVAIVAGEGMAAIFRSLGVDVILLGGQTMNPSTEDIVEAIKQSAAETVFILPNNSNIILAAAQAKEFITGQEVIVIPTKTIPQGMSAMLAFQANAAIAANTEAMNNALSKVGSGQITNAVRDSFIEGITIHKNDYLGMYNNQIVLSNPDLIQASKELLAYMIAENGEMAIATLFTGMDAKEEQTNALVAILNEAYPEVEVEVHAGDQPVYVYIFSVE